MKVKSLSRVQLFATPWTVAYQAPPSMGFSRQEYWSGLPFPFPGDLPKPGLKPRSPALEADTKALWDASIILILLVSDDPQVGRGQETNVPNDPQLQDTKERETSGTEFK